MLIKNIYRKPIKFMFVEKPITIGSNEVLEVSDEIGKEMLKNPWITEYLDRKCSKCLDAGNIKVSGSEIKKTFPKNGKEVKFKKKVDDKKKLKTK